MAAKQLNIGGIDMQLLPEKALFIPEYELLCIADWHLGKAAHFRKSGIALPQPHLEKEFDAVQRMIRHYLVRKVVFLGDLFHSKKNNDWELFRSFLHRNRNVHFILTQGNHDIIDTQDYGDIGIELVPELHLGNKIVCTHQPPDNRSADGMLNIVGHVHPGCTISTGARQRYRVPCFYVENSSFVLPSFGSLTGLHLVRPSAYVRVFPILGDEVMEIGGPDRML